jgi:sulfite reductase (ferredoxin)
VAVVKDLYANMDSSLRFPARTATAPPALTRESIKADSFHDFRGVLCPFNFVKTKLALEQMEGGQVLEVLLDEEGARSVPESASREGHEVLATAQVGDHWRVIIRKKGD